MKKGIFITGTGTDVGKTFVTAMMISAAMTHKMDIQYFKPIQTGSDSDCNKIRELSDLQSDKIHQALFSFKLPKAPYPAGMAENKTVCIETITQYWQTLRAQYCFVEGAGGLLVPLTEKLLTCDLIKALDLPILIIATTKLGTINHTLMTLQVAQAAQLNIKGIIFSGLEDPDLRGIFKRFTSIPVLAEIPLTNTADRQHFLHSAASIFNDKLLERIFA